MPLYTKKEFADLCKQKTNYLSVQIGRGKVVLNAEDKIDTKNPINALYLEKIYGRMDFVPTEHPLAAPAKKPPGKPVKKPVFDPDFDEDDEGDPDTYSDDVTENLDNPDINKLNYTQLEKIYKFRQGEHLKKRTEREEIEIAKKKGEVIPTELLPPVIVQHNQAFLTEFRNATDKILTDYTQIKDFTVEEVADMRARMLNAINHAAEEATKNSLQSIETIVKNYTEKRTAGQKL